MSADTLRDKPAGTLPCPYLVKAKSLLNADFAADADMDSAEPSSKRPKLQVLAFDPSKIAPIGNDSHRWNTGPPPGYICNRCRKPGHFIRDCTLGRGEGVPPEGRIRCALLCEY